MTESGTTEQQAQKSEVHSFGERLYAARTRQGLSTEEVAEAVNLTVDVIEAIERSEVEKLPQPAFVQGYIRVIARQLGVSEEQVLEEYSRAVPHAREAVLRPRSVLPDETNSANPLVKVVSIFVLIAIVLAAVYGIYSYYSEMADTMSIESVEDSDVLELPYQEFPLDETAASFATEEITVSNDEPATMEPAVAAEEESIQLAAVELEPVEKAEPEAEAEIKPEEPVQVALASEQQAVGSDVLELIASHSSWVDVVDADKIKLYYDLLPEGRTVVLRGAAPFNIFLGNAPAILIRLNDVQIDMTKYVRSNNIAQFSVSVSDGQVEFH